MNFSHGHCLHTARHHLFFYIFILSILFIYFIYMLYMFFNITANHFNKWSFQNWIKKYYIKISYNMKCFSYYIFHFHITVICNITYYILHITHILLLCVLLQASAFIYSMIFSFSAQIWHNIKLQYNMLMLLVISFFLVQQTLGTLYRHFTWTLERSNKVQWILSVKISPFL